MNANDELKVAFENAFSLKGDTSGLKYIGTIQKGNRVQSFYKDDSGNYWYETKFKTDHGIISEEEYIFGKKLTKRHRGNTHENLGA